VERWPRGQGADISLPHRDSNGRYNGKEVVDEFHTHPNPPVDEKGTSWTQGSHAGDLNVIADQNHPGNSYIISRDNIWVIPFNSWSMNVKIEGKNVVRHLDLTTHNHGSGPNSPPIAHKSTVAPPSVVHVRLRLKSVTFSGGSDVNNDTFGNFPTPHFLVGRAANRSPGVQRPAQFPCAIPRATKLGATAVFEVMQ